VIHIVEIGEIACQGITEPVFCRGEDGQEYVVKGSFAGRRALTAEWVAGRLGRLLGLPIPDFAQLKLDRLLLDYSAKTTEVARLGTGTLFGSRREANVVEIRQGDLYRINLEVQARVLAFDWWIANSDRLFVSGLGNPNLLWVENQQRLVVIDHTAAFDPSEMPDFWEKHAFRDARSIWSAAFCQGMAAEFKATLGHLQTIWNELPEEWTNEGTDLSFSVLESLLWKFRQDPDTFWRGQ
jgi:hypothetical protein